MITDIGMRAVIETADEHFDRITRRAGVMDWLRLMLLRRRIAAMLRRPACPVRHTYAEQLPEHIRRDIGLLPPL